MPPVTITRRAFNSNAITVAPVSPFNYPINQPAGLANGDVVLLGIATNGSAGTVTAPSGFSILTSNTTQNPRVYMMRKVITDAASEPNPWNIVGTLGVAAGVWSVAYVAVEPTTPEDASAVATANLAATSSSLTGVTTVTDGAMVVALIAINSSTATITETSALVAEVVEVAGKHNELDDGVQATAGATGTITFTISSSLASTGIVVALRPVVLPYVNPMPPLIAQ